MRCGKRKNSKKPFFFPLVFFPFLLLTIAATAQQGNRTPFKKQLTRPDSLRPIPADTSRRTLQQDTSGRRLPGDSLRLKDTARAIRIDSFTTADFSQDSLDAPINYTAEDSGVLDIPAKTFYLYGKANAKYTSMDISASVIELDNSKQLFRAYGTRDSTGKTTDLPKMTDGDMSSVSDTIIYNTRSRRGLTKSTFTQQGEIYVYAQRIKKNYDNSYFASRARFTTCNLDTPHFAFRTRKMKLINNKWAFSGLTYPEFEGVPLPIGIPFGIYPLSRGRHSGLLPPTFTATQFQGLGLEGLGYYKVINDHVDLTLRSSIYSYGSYLINVTSTYRTRYRYNGGINISYNKSQFNFKGDPDYTSSKNYSIGWNHSVDSKARPGTSFSANVNFSSSRFNRFLTSNPLANITNTQTSSISYGKLWNEGKYNLQLSATHSQNNNLGQYNISLPNLNFNVNTFYPFQKKERIGAEKWYEKLGIAYNTSLVNSFSFVDTINYRQQKGVSLLRYLLDTTQWGVTHNIPLTLSLPALGPFTISPSISYQEKWYGQKSLRSWNPTQRKLDTTIVRSIFTAREVTTALNFQTALFGTYNFKGGNLVAIRHTVRPNFSINYKPDLVRQFYYYSQVDTLGGRVRFSSFDNSPVGGFSEGQFGGMSFGIIQQLQGKVKDRSDTTGKGTKKISLIDNFSVTSSYNMFADSNKLGDIAIYLGTTLFEKVNITASTSLTPYQLNKYGQRTARYAWNGPDGFSFGSFNNVSVSMSTSLQSKKKETKPADNGTNSTESQSAYYNPDEDIRQQEYIRNHPAEFTDFSIPWTLNLSFAMNLSKTPRPDYSGFTTTTNASINLQGDFSLTPKWKIGGTSFVDVRTQRISQLTMFISRDLHCWQMSINVTPVGLYNSFNITINPKSSILRDLKVNRTRSFQTVL